PEFVKVMVAGALVVPTVCGGKSAPFFAKAIAAVPTPTPDRLRRSGLPTMLELTTSSPLNTFAAPGANASVKSHASPIPSVDGQFVDCRLNALPVTESPSPVISSEVDWFEYLPV